MCRHCCPPALQHLHHCAIPSVCHHHASPSKGMHRSKAESRSVGTQRFWWAVLSQSRVCGIWPVVGCLFSGSLNGASFCSSARLPHGDAHMNRSGCVGYAVTSEHFFLSYCNNVQGLWAWGPCSIKCCPKIVPFLRS